MKLGTLEAGAPLAVAATHRRAFAARSLAAPLVVAARPVAAAAFVAGTLAPRLAALAPWLVAAPLSSWLFTASLLRKPARVAALVGRLGLARRHALYGHCAAATVLRLAALDFARLVGAAVTFRAQNRDVLAFGDSHVAIIAVGRLRRADLVAGGATARRFFACLLPARFLSAGAAFVGEDRRVEINAGFLRQLFPKLVLQHAGLDLLHRAFGQIAQLERPEGEADQPVHGQAEMFENALDFAVLAFAQAHGEPDIGALHTVERGLDAAIFDALNRDPFGKRIQLGLGHVAMSAHAIAAQPAGGGQLQHAGQTAVVGEQQQAFGVDVEAANRDHARQIAWQILEDRRATFGIVIRCHGAAQFVEHKQARALPRPDGAPVHAHAVGLLHVESRAVERLAVDGDAAVGDPAFGVAARAKAHAGHHFSDTLAFGRVFFRRSRRVLVISLVGHGAHIAECAGKVDEAGPDGENK